MIDLREARERPDEMRAALARRGAADAFDELLAADARWRALVPQVDQLRAQQKLDGKPTPEQLEQLKQLKEELRSLEDELAAAESAREERSPKYRTRHTSPRQTDPPTTTPRRSSAGASRRSSSI